MDYFQAEIEDEGMETEESEGYGDLTVDKILFYSGEGVNLADILDDSERTKIANRCCDDFTRDKESRQGWDEDMADWIKLVLQVKEEKTYPWPGAANIKFPLETVSVIQFASRIGPAIVRTPYPVSGRVNGYSTPQKEQAANRLAKHMSWQLTDQMPTWVDDQDTLFHILPITGCAFKKTYRDTTLGTNVSELVMPDRLVFDYYAKSVEDARCVTHWFYMHKQEIVQQQRMGVYRECELKADSPSDDFETRDIVNNTEADTGEYDNQIKIFEQHTWYDLDGDGLEEPYICIIAEESKQLLRMEPRFTPEGVLYNPATGKVGMFKADSYFTQYIFLPDPSGGNLGIGWGRILGPINESVNTLINQILDKGTLNNLSPYFIDSGFKVEGGNIAVEPGKPIRVKGNGADLAKGIVPVPQSEPSQVLYMLLTLLVNWGQRITAVTDSMAGEIPASNVPATTTLAMLEQGQKVFQGIYARIYRAMGRELKKIKELNRRYMSDIEYFSVLDNATGTPGVVFRNDYLGDDTDVTLTAEPTLPSEQVAMARLRICMEAANAGIRVNPKYMEMLFIQTLALPEDAAGDVILPEAGPSPVEMAKMAEMQAKAQQGAEKNQLEAMRLETENKRIDTDTAFKTAQLRLEHENEKIEHMLKRGELGVKEADVLHKMSQENEKKPA